MTLNGQENGVGDGITPITIFFIFLKKPIDKSLAWVYNKDS
jgi:hypothetical protein